MILIIIILIILVTAALCLPRGAITTSLWQPRNNQHNHYYHNHHHHHWHCQLCHVCLLSLRCWPAIEQDLPSQDLASLHVCVDLCRCVHVCIESQL